MSDRTSARISIAAPPAAVLAVIADVAAYPDWNAEVRSAEVLAVTDDGRPERARFVVDASLIKDTYVLRYTWDGSGVSWTLDEAKLLTGMDGSYALAPHGDGATQVTYTLAVELNIPVLGLLRRKGEKVIIDRALKGLKARVESLEPSGGSA